MDVNTSIAYNFVMPQTEQKKKAMIKFECQRKLASDQAAIRQSAIQAKAAILAASTKPKIDFALTILSVVFAMLCLIPVVSVGLWLRLTSSAHSGHSPSLDGSVGMFLGPFFAYFFGGGAYCMVLSVTCSAIAQQKAERFIQIFHFTLMTICATPYLIGLIYLLKQIL